MLASFCQIHGEATKRLRAARRASHGAREAA
jgi:hypothetical protein